MSEKLILHEHIISKVVLLREQKVILDSDLADLYNVPVKRLKERVKRNLKRFPDDFMFELSQEEYHFLRTNYFKNNKRAHGKHIKYLPYAFTEQGVAMLSSVLKSTTAIEVNIKIMRAFVQLRQVLSLEKTDLEKLADIERIQKIHGHLLHEHNDNIEILFEALRQEENTPDEEKRKIGFMR